MTVKIQTEQGLIELSNEVIATVVGGAATDNYGVVGMASRNHIRDNLNEILKKENRKNLEIEVIGEIGTKIYKLP